MKRVVPGVHSVSHALKVRPRAIEEIRLRKGPQEGEIKDLIDLARSKNVPVNEYPTSHLDKIIESHQGIIATLKDGPPWPSIKDLKDCEQGTILVLDNINDPHNLGSMIRSAWNLGALAVFASKDRAAGIQSPAAQKVASGGFEYVPFEEVANVHAELKNLKDAGFWIYGLDASSDQEIHKMELAKKAVFVVGSEESGIKSTTLSACDFTVKIPQIKTADSFNASVSGALALYEHFRQHSK
jgi:23S rRNA (guanosine2251-2'-O)-methyltransferase